MSPKNFPEIHLSRLDHMVNEIPAAERLEIILEYSELERVGKIGNGPLRQRAGEIFRALQGRSGFDATYMLLVGLSCHKLNSIEALMGPLHSGVEQRSQLLDDGGRVAPLEGDEFSDLCNRIEAEPRPLLDPREMAAVRTGLRLVQAELERSDMLPLGMSEILDNGGTLEPLRAAEFDELCERIDALAGPDLDDARPAP